MIAIVRLAGLSAREQTLTYSVILFWLCLNLYFQLLACYVAVGRERKADYTMQALTMQGSLKGEKEICTVTCEGFSDTTVLLKRKGGIREQKGELILGRSNLVLPVFKKETPGEQQESELTEERAYIFEIDPSRWQEEQKKVIWNFCMTVHLCCRSSYSERDIWMKVLPLFLSSYGGINHPKIACFWRFR